MPHSVFALPEHLAAKNDPELVAADETLFAAIAHTISQSISELVTRLDAARRAPGGVGQEAMDRDLEVHRLTARLRLLRRFGRDLCLGRMVSAADGGEPVYVGRLGLTDSGGRRLLIDWRSPAAEPFFAATHAHPMGLASRRRYRWTRSLITDFWDEVYASAPGSDEELGQRAALDDQSAFIASLGSTRSPRMRDVLGTIQADQDAIIRAGSTGALVVDGGPGTGKTVVALHRAAYLLYSDPRLGHHRGGVLFVGPHQPYLAYVGDVLPSLGEEGVQTCMLRDLVVEGASATDEDTPEVARLKATADLVGAVEPAVQLYEEAPGSGTTVQTPWSDVWLSPADWAEAFGARTLGRRTTRPVSRCGGRWSPSCWTGTTTTSRPICCAGRWPRTRTWWAPSTGAGRSWSRPATARRPEVRAAPAASAGGCRRRARAARRRHRRSHRGRRLRDAHDVHAAAPGPAHQPR